MRGWTLWRQRDVIPPAKNKNEKHVDIFCKMGYNECQKE